MNAAPADGPRRAAWEAWAVGAAPALVAAGVHAATHRGETIGPVTDEALIVPIAQRAVGLADFAGDRWFATVAPIFSIPYSWILGALLRVFDDPIVALRVLSVPFHVVLLAGTWRLVDRASGRAAAAVAVLLLVLPPFADVVYAPGAALPRELVFALLPWFLMGTFAAPTRSRTARIALYFALGLVANLHPLTAVHAAMWLLLLDVVRDASSKGVRDAAVNGVAFAIGAAPYIVQYLARSVAPGAVDPSVYAWRLGSMAGETFGAWTLRMEPVLWICGAAAVAVLAARRAGAAPSRTLVVAMAIAVGVAAVGPTLGRFIVPLRGFQFARFERIADWCAAMLVATGAVAAWRGRRFGALAATTALVAAAPILPVVLGGTPPRGPLARIGRKFDRDAGLPADAPPPADLAARRDVADPTSAATRDAFLATCAFARGRTSADALFIVPPEEWGPFRAYALRGVAVTRKEGGAALSFLGAAGMQWYRDYADVVRVYAAGGPDEWDTLARRWKAAYVVVDASTSSPPKWPTAFEAGPFRVLSNPRN